VKDNTEQRSKLIHLAAGLLKSRLPDYREDYPKSVPKYVVEGIKAHNNALRIMAIEIREISDSLNNE